MATRESTPLGKILEQLLALQAIDSERDRITRSRANLDSGAAHRLRSTDARAAVDGLQSRLAQAHSALKDAELEQSGVEAKIKAYEERQRSGQVTNAREISNIQREIGQLIRQRGSLDDKILTLMDQIDSGRAEIEGAEGRAREAEQEATTQTEAHRAKVEGLDAEMNRLNGERGGAAASIADPAMFRRYETLRARPASAGIAVSRVVDSHCSACRTQVGTSDADKVRDAAQVTTCETCGRILAAVD